MGEIALLAAASLGAGLAMPRLVSNRRSREQQLFCYDDAGTRRDLDTGLRLYRRPIGPPTRRDWEVSEQMRLFREVREASRKARQAAINPQYTSEPEREEFPSRQAYRRAVRLWKTQGCRT